MCVRKHTERGGYRKSWRAGLVKIKFFCIKDLSMSTVFTQYAILNTQYNIIKYASRTTQYASRNRPLHLSRELYKSTLFMQNKANFKNDQIYISACFRGGYDDFLNFSRPKNKAKQSQNKANFGPKLASFSSILALFRGRANRCTNCQDGSKMRNLADERQGGRIYKTISGKQLAKGCLAK